jgi:ATP-dependent DNA ligase
VGYYDKDFLYAAKVRNGFVPANRERLFERFRALERTTCPFRTYLKQKGDDGVRGLSAAIMIVCRWLEPRLVAAIEFLEWTPENHLRYSRFVALRQDKEPDRIRRDATSQTPHLGFGASARWLA